MPELAINPHGRRFAENDQSSPIPLVTALLAARHELTTLHGLVAFDGEAPAETWSINTGKTVAQIDRALAIAMGKPHWAHPGGNP